MTYVNKVITSKYPKYGNHCLVFKGKTFSQLYIKVENCMKEIIDILKSETGCNDWIYDEGGVKIEKKLKFADKFVEKSDW